jgi:hypothetical protein
MFARGSFGKSKSNPPIIATRVASVFSIDSGDKAKCSAMFQIVRA